jgi:hypothetical protein
MKKSLFGGVAALCLLTGCTADQVASVQANQAKVQAAIQSACADVNSAAALAAPFSAIPQIGAILDYATASCATANAMAALTSKAVNDPATVAWAQNLAAQIRAIVPKA